MPGGPAQEIQPWIVQLFQIASSIGTIIAILAAFLQFKAWRRELVGKTKFQLAHKLAVLAIRTRSEFSYARHPMIFGEPTSQTDRGETGSNDSAHKDTWHEMAKRLEPVRKVLNEMETVKWEAELLLDAKDLLPITQLQDCYKDIFIAHQMYHHVALMGDQHVDINNQMDEVERQRRIIYSFSDRDEFGDKIDRLVTQLTNGLKKYLQQ
jgi:hypothetical protein